jgi:hypothetical protein
LEKKKAPMEITRVRYTIGLMIRGREIPADFMASNSLFSPIPPIVINEAKRVDKGRAMGTNPAEAYSRSSAITSALKPFPTRSSMYFHRNCISRINMTMKKVRSKGPRYVFKTNRCKRFIDQQCPLGKNSEK